MDEQPDPQPFTVQLEYAFDRLHGHKLEHAYGILVTDQVRVAGTELRVKEENNEKCSNLCTGIFGQAEGKQYDRQSDGSTGCLRPRSRLQRS